MSKHVVLGGGIRFKGDGERFLHDNYETTSNSQVKSKAVSINQRAMGFRFFVEPFLSGRWSSGKWQMNAEYGLRLYRMSTTEKTGHAVTLYNFMDSRHPLSGSTFTHFYPLVNGRARLTHTLSKHHRLSLSNTISNRLPTSSQTVLSFEQMNEFNKIRLGNPHLKPEVRMLLSLDHTFTSGAFSATTAVSAQRTNNQMDFYHYGCIVEGRSEVAHVALNVANVSTYKVSETLTWNSRWLKAQATLWRHWEHHHGIGTVFGGHTMNDKNWGWQVEANASLGSGWLVEANFQYMGGYNNISTKTVRSWQSSTASIAKSLGHITLYLTANSLLNPAVHLSKYNADGFRIYHKKTRDNNRVVLLGCRWAL